MSKNIKKRKKVNQKTYYRFDIDDKTWEKIVPHLTGQRWQRIRIAKNNRKSVVWILRIRSL